MKQSIVLEYNLIERLTHDADIENIIIGTGALARDMRKKLQLLGLKAPFFIGDRSDDKNEIRHYSEIAGLGDPKQYRFIICCDIDEWTLIAPAQTAAYKFLGNAARNHPQVINFSAVPILHERAGKYITDSVNCDIILRDGRPYVVYGDENDKDSFRIHFLGFVQIGGILEFTRKSSPKLLHALLTQAGFNSTIYAWSQSRNPLGNNIMSFIRDVCFQKVDLLILYSGLVEQNPIRVVVKNGLSTRAGTVSSNTFTVRVNNTYSGEISSGINHDINLTSLRQTQQRVFIALSRIYGFQFWDIIAPLSTILPEDQAIKFCGLSSGYLSKQKKRINEALNILDKQYTKDYTDTFIDVDDIYSMYADSMHLSDEGNRLVAERCASEILDTFGDRKW